MKEPRKKLCVCALILDVFAPGVEVKCPIHPNAPHRRLVIERERQRRLRESR